MRAMSRMLSTKRASRETPRTSANGRDALASLEEEPPYATGDDAQGLSSARDGDDTIDEPTREDYAADVARLAARLAEAEARAFHLENQLEHASARAESAERRASAAEQRERAAFHERAAASSDPGMPRPPRWLATDAGTGTGTGTSTATDAAMPRETAAASVPASERAEVSAPRAKLVATYTSAHTQTDGVAQEEPPYKTPRKPEIEHTRRALLERTETARGGSSRVAPPADEVLVTPTELARARRAARQSGDKERAMVAQLNAYRRAKDQSEKRVRELAAELAEAAKDLNAWQSQARRVASGVAEAKESWAREARGTPRASRGGEDVAAFGDTRDGDVSDGDVSDVSDVSDLSDVSDVDDASCEGGRKNADDHKVFRRVRHGRVADVAALVSSGVDVDIRDRFGNTPLVVAAQNDRKRISKLLVKAGADLNATNVAGNASLHYCYAYGHFDLAEFLERRGADVSVRNEAGVAPRDVLEGDADANARWREAKRDAETRRAVSAEARRRRSEKDGGGRGATGDSDDGFGTDADGGLETSDDESDETPRRGAGTIREKSHDAFTFAEDVNDDEEGGMRSYRALVSGRG
jgi:hypothetical protein